MPAMSDPTYLRDLPLFRAMHLKELVTLNKLMRRHTLPAAGRIQLADQLEDTTYIVLSGVVRIAVGYADGTELIVAILGPGDVVGSLTIDESRAAAHSILPINETQLLWIDRNAFEECLKTMPQLSANLVNVLGRQLRLSNERIEALAGVDVRTRLLRHLVLLAREYGEPVADSKNGCVRIPLRLTQTTLGHLVGASRVRVNQAVAELGRRGVLEPSGDQCLLITDVAVLADVAD